jgi:hypothetical protein
VDPRLVGVVDPRESAARRLSWIRGSSVLWIRVNPRPVGSRGSA